MFGTHLLRLMFDNGLDNLSIYESRLKAINQIVTGVDDIFLPRTKTYAFMKYFDSLIIFYRFTYHRERMQFNEIKVC